MGSYPARTINFDLDGFPEIQVRREWPHLVFCTPCPLCGLVHRHGAMGGYGHRAAHCPPGTPGSRRGYRLVKLAKANQEERYVMEDVMTEKQPPAPLNVIACPHPFKLAHEEHSLAPTLSLSQILREVQPDALLCRRAHIWVNDKYIDPGKWDSTYPEPGSKIDIRVVPSGKAGRVIGSVFIAIAAIVVSVAAIMLTAGTALAAFGPLIGGIAGLAVGIVGNMALNALFPPARPGGAGTLSALAAVPGLSDYGQSSPTLSITGASNKANLWGPVPFILGRHRVFPFYGARVYTESAGSDQYLRLFFVWGVK